MGQVKNQEKDLLFVNNRKNFLTCLFLSFIVFTPDVHAICNPFNALTTQPQLPNDILANGYVNFTVHSCFDLSSYFSCSWYHGIFRAEFYDDLQRCFSPSTTHDTYIIKCSEESRMIKTSFTLQTQMTFNDFRLDCYGRDSETNSLHLFTYVYLKSKHVYLIKISARSFDVI